MFEVKLKKPAVRCPRDRAFQAIGNKSYKGLGVGTSLVSSRKSKQDKASKTAWLQKSELGMNGKTR